MSDQTVDVERMDRVPCVDEFQDKHEPVPPTSSQGVTIAIPSSISLHTECDYGKADSKPNLWSRWLTALSTATKHLRWHRSMESVNHVLPIIRKIHGQPGGYPQLATFIDSDESFMTYRRFGYLQSRLILDKQEELSKLEQALDNMEADENGQTPEQLRTQWYSPDKKQELFDTIEVKWNAYCQLLLNASGMIALNKPTTPEWNNVTKWMLSTDSTCYAEAAFVRHREDLVTLRTRDEYAWLDYCVKKIWDWASWPSIRRMFESKETREKWQGSGDSFMYTRSRIERSLVGFISIMILVLLILPIWALSWLAELQKDLHRVSFEGISILFVSTLVFSACLSICTRARRHETIGASAAYCAVLVVFIGNIGQH